MPQVINTNSMSLMARNNLNKSQSSLNSAIEKLSSGKRINSAKDGASESAIANRFTANIRGLTQASRNANDGISIAQTAEGALNEINTNVQRIRELAVKSANGTNSDADKAAIQKEVDQRLEEIDRISKETDFNGIKLLSREDKPAENGKPAEDGKPAEKGKPAQSATIKIQVGANDNEVIELKLAKVDSAGLGLEKFSLVERKTKDKDGKDVSAPATKDPMATLDKALSQIDNLRSQFGAAQNRFESAITNIENTTSNLSSALSRIQDADYAEEVSNMTRAQILQQAGTSVLAQANQVPQMVLSLLR